MERINNPKTRTVIASDRRECGNPIRLCKLLGDCFVAFRLLAMTKCHCIDCEVAAAQIFFNTLPPRNFLGMTSVAVVFFCPKRRHFYDSRMFNFRYVLERDADCSELVIIKAIREKLKNFI